MILIEEAEEILEPDVSDQEFTSSETSINSSKLPAIFKMIPLNKGTVNLDIGGGKFDNATEYLATVGVTNLVYDPYNRSYEHNRSVIKEVSKNGGADSVTCSNVLNVIKEREARLSVIRNCYKYLKSGKKAYFTVYEGTGARDSKPSTKGYQLNWKTGDYVSEIAEVFGDNVIRKGKLIVATK